LPDSSKNIMEAGQKKDRKICRTAKERQVVRTTSTSRQGSKETYLGTSRLETNIETGTVGRAANRCASRQDSKQ